MSRMNARAKSSKAAGSLPLFIAEQLLVRRALVQRDDEALRLLVEIAPVPSSELEGRVGQHLLKGDVHGRRRGRVDVARLLEQQRTRYAVDPRQRDEVARVRPRAPVVLQLREVDIGNDPAGRRLHLA